MTHSPASPSAKRSWHAQAGDLLADDYNVPGIVMISISVAGLAFALVAAGTDHWGWFTAAVILTVVTLVGGIAALVIEHQREKRIELAIGRAGHPVGKSVPIEYGPDEIRKKQRNSGSGTS
ncbi:hypothetical protein [Nocardia camponoti]|uniref:UsfY protein n=1 Tax=Nocardia camponoti TaxID=1616106 RepID=A0A917Q856_9NOCA|nr:hypothetical protein [Nocardia camponoti]GGK34782.1 hypothetical protein GCM10011591_03040 [Nocardia camponoti]